MNEKSMPVSIIGASLAILAFFPSQQAYHLHLIKHYALLYGINQSVAVDVAWCESRLTNVQSDNYPKEDSFGVYQLQSEFWTRQARRFGYPDNPILRKSPEANISLALKVASKDGWGEWSCKNKIKNYYYGNQFD